MLIRFLKNVKYILLGGGSGGRGSPPPVTSVWGEKLQLEVCSQLNRPRFSWMWRRHLHTSVYLFGCEMITFSVCVWGGQNHSRLASSTGGGHYVFPAAARLSNLSQHRGSAMCDYHIHNSASACCVLELPLPCFSPEWGAGGAPHVAGASQSSQPQLRGWERRHDNILPPRVLLLPGIDPSAETLSSDRCFPVAFNTADRLGAWKIPLGWSVSAVPPTGLLTVPTLGWMRPLCAAGGRWPCVYRMHKQSRARYCVNRRRVPPRSRCKRRIFIKTQKRQNTWEPFILQRLYSHMEPSTPNTACFWRDV